MTFKICSRLSQLPPVHCPFRVFRVFRGFLITLWLKEYFELFFEFVGQATGSVAQYIVMKEISSELVATQAESRPSVPSLPLTTLISLPRSPLPRLDQSSRIKVDKGGSNQIKPKRFFPAQSSYGRVPQSTINNQKVPFSGVFRN